MNKNINQLRTGKSVKAFTLIELLVVIAIIAILAAILFPVFGRARENARRSSCQSNMKQIGLGVMQYSQDYDEKYPAYARFINGDTVYWMTGIMPYVKSTQLFACPSNTTQADTRQGVPNMYNANYYADYPDYGAVRNVGNGIGVFCDRDAPGISAASLQSAASSIAVSELRTGDLFLPPSGYDNNAAGFHMFSGHLTTANYLFADGHVKALKPFQTITPVNMWTSRKSSDPADTGTDQSKIVPTGLMDTLKLASDTYK